MIRQAKLSDLESIAQVHTECFPDSFSTALGKRLLTKFYYEYISKIPELFLVSQDQGNSINGFCMGYYMENDHYMKSFIKHNLVSVAFMMLFRLITLDKRAWKKIKKKSTPDWEILNHEYDDIPNDLRIDLLSICVLKKYRGHGIANQLIDEYQKVVARQERKLCMLSVDVKNARGIHFYEKHGFKLYREAPGVARTYYKIVEE